MDKTVSEINTGKLMILSLEKSAVMAITGKDSEIFAEQLKPFRTPK